MAIKHAPAALGRPDLEDPAEALDPRPRGAGAAASRAGHPLVVHRNRHDADPRRGHRRTRCASGRVEVVAAVEGFDGADVLLADGSRIQPDAVIAATGFRAGLDELVGSPRRAHAARAADEDRRRAGASRPLVRRLHADARRPASRRQHRRPQGGRRASRELVGTDRFELSASASQTQRSNQAELRPVRQV